MELGDVFAGPLTRGEIQFPVLHEFLEHDPDTSDMYAVWRKGGGMLRYDSIERHDPATSRIYIVLREQILKFDLGHSALSIAHAMAAASREWQDDWYFEHWRKLSFRKFLGIANEKEWTKLKTVDAKHLVMTESGVEGNPELSMIFEPMGGDEVPNVLKHLRPLSWKHVQAPSPTA